MTSSKPKLIAVVGTTASGKSALAMQLAKQFNGEIVSVDSRQIYKDMDIGTNKDAGELVSVERTNIPVISVPKDCPVSLNDVLTQVYTVDGIPNYMISIVSPDQLLTLAHFKALAQGVIADIIARGKLPILVGGTSLYTTAIVQNWLIPDVKPNLEARKQLEAMTTEQLVARLRAVAPERLETIDVHNPRRLIRAIEIASGEAEPTQKGDAQYDVLLIAPTVEQALLNTRINERVDLMVANGLIDEVKRVGEQYGYDRVAMTGHAYQQIGWFLQGKMSRDVAIALSKKVTRAYAKRQKTWWKKYGPVTWVKNVDEAKQQIANFLQAA